MDYLKRDDVLTAIANAYNAADAAFDAAKDGSKQSVVIRHEANGALVAMLKLRKALEKVEPFTIPEKKDNDDEPTA